jgi:hypothetical protein
VQIRKTKDTFQPYKVYTVALNDIMTVNEETDVEENKPQ